MYAEQVERMARSCAGARPPGFVVGERTITRNYQAADDLREEGRIANPGYAGRVWRGGTPQQVIEAMEKALGPVGEGAYRTVE